MKNLTYVKPEKISLKNNPELNEKWVQEKIAEDPSILGLGDLILKDKERIQPKAGRLDVLLQNADSNQRYEVEIQLGQTDESHIIRTIEYWDIERKRYPQYDHTAVIVAEDITSRFLNVISLFNGYIPLVAIQLNAIKVGENVSIVCTTVLNEMSLGLVDEDEESHEVTDRTYWEEQRGSKMTVSMTDNILEIIKTFAPELSLKYNKFYIGLAKNEQTNNFVIFRPQKTILRLEVRLPRSDEVETKLEGIGLDVMDYDQRWGRYRIRLSKEDVKKHSAFLAEFLGTAYNNTVL
jgi:predicted transport protein